MKLRNLEEKDLALMLEWMKDSTLTCFFTFKSDDIKEKDVLNFIKKSKKDLKNKHYAIVNENDEYLGTISLKNIDFNNKNAEYAISLRKSAIGKGIAFFATKSILNIAFGELNLNKVYLNVLSDNIRAIKFYEKFGFIYEGEFINHIIINNQYRSLKWYSIFNEEWQE